MLKIANPPAPAKDLNKSNLRFGHTYRITGCYNPIYIGSYIVLLQNGVDAILFTNHAALSGCGIKRMLYGDLSDNMSFTPVELELKEI